MRLTRSALFLALAGVAASAAVALAEDAPKSSATSKTLYLAQEGCGETAEAGRLEPKAQADSADGCGTIGGVPIDEVIYQADGPAYEDYTSTSRMAPFLIDANKPVKGQIAAASWVGEGVGVGAVDVDVHLIGKTAAGRSVDFGEATGTASVTPGTNVVFVPFTLKVPAAAAGQKFTKFVLSVAVHGANLGMSAKKLQGDSYLVIPAKPAPVRRR